MVTLKRSSPYLFNSFVWILLVVMLLRFRPLIYRHSTLIMSVFAFAVFISFFLSVYLTLGERRLLYFLKYAFYLALSLMFFGLFAGFVLYAVSLERSTLTFFTGFVFYASLIAAILSAFYRKKEIFCLVIYGNNAALLVLFSFFLFLSYNRGSIL